MTQPRRVAIVGGNRIPFARSNTVYATASNQEMLTSALDGLVERFNLHGERLGEVVAGAVLGTLGMVDYYGAGVLTVFIFYFFHGHGRKWWCLLGQLAALYWVNVELLGGLMYPIQLFGMDFELCQQGLALLALVPIWLYRGRQGYHSKPFQYACYAFYPVHMLLLVLVLNFVNR